MINQYITNTGDDTLLNFLKNILNKNSEIYLSVDQFSIYAFYDLRKEIRNCKSMRVLLTKDIFNVEKGSFSRRRKIARQNNNIFGNQFEFHLKNKMNLNHVARVVQSLIGTKVQFKLLKSDNTFTHQMSIANTNDERIAVIPNIQNFASDGIGSQPGNSLMGPNAIIGDKSIANNNIQRFNCIWDNEEYVTEYTNEVYERLSKITQENTPEWLYYVSLYHIFHNHLDELDEENTIREGTGFKDTAIWNQLYQFQKDGVVGLISKLEKYNGAILADSVGLGKTYSALAVIKYYELRNDRVLVLAPKRLRENWTVYTKNDVRNELTEDHFHYDVLNHTDLSRYSGYSGDINLGTINWDNYDLVVIDESHNFRNNNPTSSENPSRYQRLMNEIIKDGVPTKVLMLSATPVNNRMTDLKNQIAFITEDNPHALSGYGVESIDNELRLAQMKYNDWAKLDDYLRTTRKFLEMVNPGYFKILDLLTIARSRKHITKYYDITEIGCFPERLKPISIKSDVDTHNSISSIKDVNDEISSLNLSLYQQMAYILPSRRRYYEELYDTKTSRGIFRQEDRETYLTGLIRVNLLKRLESSINSFELSVSRMVKQIEDIVAIIEKSKKAEIELPSLVDYEDEELETAFEDYAVGKKNKILLGDMDLHRWKIDLSEDLERLRKIQEDATTITVNRDAKLGDLLELIDKKIKNPINPGNKKILIFTAFTDTANYLYDN